MNYLIPKSARNVRLLLFKNLGVAEVLITLIGTGFVVLLFSTNWNFYIQLLVSVFIFFIVVFLISPSFAANKKGYESFGAIFDFWSAPKKYVKKRKKTKF